jgi:hypothetical protein
VKQGVVSNLYGQHFLGSHTQIIQMTFRMNFNACQIGAFVPKDGLKSVAFNTFTAGVALSETHARQAVSLLSGAPVPHSRCSVVLRNAAADRVQVAQIMLRSLKPLLRGKP